ncbi:enoyl-CoA hydratase [Mesorhizobium waimense]|uniref:Enoyl-CoA hydratase n=1 Tax=Mesorhizobium waimense TaxID=1300307 RepID=A0A3A5KXG2_9HYPH|nr:crotonase/enoyl-CoA hydratase family protein [Mesorhizobium waimense]RJT41452.1 enoyl-CoA hydratase [Mesorhizobium waimense]
MAEAKIFIDVSIEDGVALATLNSPETRNALGDASHFQEMDALCAHIAADRSIRVLVLTGAGKAFCAGGDIKQMYSRITAPGAQVIDERYGYKSGFHRLPKALYELEVPTIAAVNGPAIGAGLDLACMCDLRIASEEAVFAESFVKLGIVPGDGGAWLLQRIIGPQKAAEMTFTGDLIGAAEALACGLVLKVVPHAEVVGEAMAMARRIAANPGDALRMTKRLMREALHTRLDTLLELSAAFQALAHFTPDHRTRLDAAVGRISHNTKTKG